MTEKKEKKNGIGYKLVMLILIGIIAFSAYKLGVILYGYYEGNSQYEQVQQVAGTKNSEKFTGDVDFESLLKQNEDVKAWIYSEGTPINYPVVQGPDNDYYLYRMFNGEYNGAGSIFIDYRNDEPFDDFNTVLHGHRMKDGSMFKDLIKYREKDYYENHKVMQLTTPEAYYDLVIFGVITIPSDSEMYRFDFFDEAARQEYLDYIYANTEMETDVEVTPDDKIVMMSTCTFEYDDARLCVYGKLEKKGDYE